MRSSLFAACALAVLLTGCNTLDRDSFQQIKVETPGVAGADCMLVTEKMKYRVITPGTVMVERAPYNMTVTCEKGNYFPSVLVVKPEIKMLGSAWNVLNGVIPGTAYDIASRSVYSYPVLITMEMEEDPDALNVAGEQETREPPRRRVEEEPVKDMSPKADDSFSGSLRK